jgi:hypothetical protein
MASTKSGRDVKIGADGGTDTQDLPGLPVDSDDRRQAIARRLPMGGVVELEPQPAIPHRLTSSNLAAASTTRKQSVRRSKGQPPRPPTTRRGPDAKNCGQNQTPEPTNFATQDRK